MIKVQISALSFWQFSLNFYNVKNVQKHLLDLQDRFDFNVNVLLFCLYCDSLKINLCKLVLTKVLDSIKSNDIQLQKHREKRRKAKNNSESDNQLDKTPYQAYLAQELEMEKAQQGQIVAAYRQECAPNSSSRNANHKQDSLSETCMQVYVDLHFTKHSNLLLCQADAQKIIQKLNDLREKHNDV